MKKVLLFLILLVILTGCTNLNKVNTDKIIDEVINSKVKLNNQYRTGYKYYLPSSLTVIKSLKMNEIIGNDKVKYYLFVDLISNYYNKNLDYTVNNEAYYAKEFSYQDLKGYLEINVKNDKYLIEIIYNYAKIEVIVDKEDINLAVANSLIILSSIEYQKSIIENMIGEDILSYSEEAFTIFDSKTKDSNFLEYVQEFDTYNTDIPDYDLIN